MFAAEVCEHFYRPGVEFQRLRKLVKRGGVLGLMTQLYDGVTFKDWYYRREPSHVVFYSKDTLGWIAKNFGFEHVSVLDKRTAIFS